MSRQRKKCPQGIFKATIETLSHEGRGLTHISGKIVFIDAALPAEEVMFRYVGIHSKFDEGIVDSVIKASAQRILPKCQYFSYCGGCSLQHINEQTQLAHKQQVLLEQLSYFGNVKPESVLPPLTGPSFAYRHKARLGVKYVIKKGKVLVGFREKYSSYIADISACEVLHPAVGQKLSILQQLIANLSIYDQIPQIEVAVADNGTALVIRHLAPLTQDDMLILQTFEKEQQFKLYLQPAGYDSCHRLGSHNNNAALFYRLHDQAICLYFHPTDFTQINVVVNQKMVNLAIKLLKPSCDDLLLDLFCGIGNFTLPLSKKAKSVTGIEGNRRLVQHAKDNAVRNNIENVEFHVVDLAKLENTHELMQRPYTKMLLDPARTGAKEILSTLNLKALQRIVYVSCNPATLARDANILVNAKGFKLKKLGIIDMFPHTTHVESIALFCRQ